MSKHTPLGEWTRRDTLAADTLWRGIQRHEPNIRFITLTGVTKMIYFKKLVKFLRKKMKFEYFGVRTGEGLGVIHLVYGGGKSIKWKELKEKWREISGYWNVHISKVTNVYKVMNELLRQYKKIRYFHSRNWINTKSKQQDFAGKLLEEYWNEKEMQFRC